MLLSIQRFLEKFSGDSNPDKGEDLAYKHEDMTIRTLRKIANPLVDLVEPFSFITPNRLTWLSFAIQLLGAVILAVAGDDVFLLFMAGFFIWFSAVVDSMDGQLARQRGIASRRGEWLDKAMDDLKGFPFLIALGINISDVNGFFTLQIGDLQFNFNTWFVLCILIGSLAYIIIFYLHSTMIFNEPQYGSFGHIYIAWGFLILNLLELYLVLLTIVAGLGVLYTLFEKTFLPQKEP